MTVRNPTTGELTTVLETASIAHLGKRGWKGLEQRLGMDEPSELEEGREALLRGIRTLVVLERSCSAINTQL